MTGIDSCEQCYSIANIKSQDLYLYKYENMIYTVQYQVFSHMGREIKLASDHWGNISFCVLMHCRSTWFSDGLRSVLFLSTLIENKYPHSARSLHFLLLCFCVLLFVFYLFIFSFLSGVCCHMSGGLLYFTDFLTYL